MQFEMYPVERLAIESIASRLTAQENDFRKQLIDYTINAGKPFNLNHTQPAAFHGVDAKKMTNLLITKRAVAVGQNGDVNFMYPVSAVPTCHEVYLDDGRRLFAMCAVDALGTAFTFGQDVRVQSKCSECGTPVTVEVRGGKITTLHPEAIRVLHVDLNKFDNWAGST